MPALLIASVLLFASVPASACASGPDREAEAAAAVATWLRAVEAAGVDEAWALLHPVTRTAIYHDDRDAFAGDVAAAGGRTFEWAIREARLDDVHYLVALDVEAGPDAMPQFLLERAIFKVSDWDGTPVPDTAIRIDFPFGQPLVFATP